MAISWVRRFFDGYRRSRPIRPKARIRGFRPEVETLAQRVMPAVTASFSAASGQLRIIGDDLDNTLVVSREAAGAILVNGGGVAIQGDPGASIANVFSIMMVGSGGNDNLSVDESNGALPPASLFGGDGNDILTAGSGMDFVDGGKGNDTVLLGAGDDTFQWNPGDGSDVVDGQAGIDNLVFNGSDAAEKFDFSDTGNEFPTHRLRLTRDAGNVAMNLTGIETIDLNTFGGADTITVNDQTATGLLTVNLDLANSAAIGDGQADAVILNGTNGDDVGQIASVGSTITARIGLVPLVNITAAEGTIDTLTVNALDGSDDVDASLLSANLIGLIVNGGDGNDVILGSQGKDVVTGGPGDDTVMLQAGDDTFVWNPGDGNDHLEGQDGADRFNFNGDVTAEKIAISRNGSRIRLTRDAGSVTMDVNGFEGIDLNAFGGHDVVTVNDLSGTGLVKVQMNLNGLAGGDGQVDDIFVNATNDNDVIQLSAAANIISVDGLFPTVRIIGAEAANDRLTINTLGGNDVVDDSKLPANLIGLNVNLGGQPAPPPTITSVNPFVGPTNGQFIVDIFGAGFDYSSVLTSAAFGGVLGTNVTIISANHISVVAPAHAFGFADVTVATPSGMSVSTGTLATDRIEYKIPPTLVSEILNGADPELLNLAPGTENQHSMVRSFRLTFDRPVILTADAAALVLDNPNPEIPGAIPVVTSVNSTGGAGADTVWNVTFSGPNTDPGSHSVVDGKYALTIDPAKVTDADGLHLAAAPVPFAFYKLLGDSNGDRTVNTIDLINIRRLANTTSASPDYQWTYDTNWDGTINTLDIIAFRRNAGKAI